MAEHVDGISIHHNSSIQIYSDLRSFLRCTGYRQVTDRLQTGYRQVTLRLRLCFPSVSCLLLPGHVVLRTLPAECWCQCGPQRCCFSLGPSWGLSSRQVCLQFRKIMANHAWNNATSCRNRRVLHFFPWIEMIECSPGFSQTFCRLWNQFPLQRLDFDAGYWGTTAWNRQRERARERDGTDWT